MERASDPRKTAFGIAAVEIFFHHFLDDGTKISVLPLESALIFSDKFLKIMKEHPLEESLLRVSQAVDSSHSREDDSKNRPEFGENWNRLILLGLE